MMRDVSLRLTTKAIREAVSALLLAACVALGAVAQERATYTNPVIAGDWPDPSVVRVGEDYWATTTTGTWAPHYPILHSRDLVNWRTVGYVFQKKPAWVKNDFWAPEITHDRGRFFVYYTARRDEGAKKIGTLCVAVATAARPEGPYTDHGPLACEIKERKNVGSIDAFFVRDEAGAPYLVWKADGNDAEPDEPTSIYAQRLTDDGLKLTGKRKEILRNTEAWERHVTEGSYIMRRGEWFYHFYSGNACCGRGCNYALGVARSRKLLGPWKKHPRGPILAANSDWKCPGHGTVVSTPDGRDFMLYHSYRRRGDTFNVGREAVLDEVTWGDDGWPAINQGHGPSSVAPSPHGATEADDEPEFFDEFDAPQLDLEWTWPMSNEQTARAEAAEGGRLVLESSKSGQADEWASAVAARRTVSGSYTATTLVDLRRTSAGGRAGLAAYSWREWSVGISAGGGKISVWRREGKDLQTVVTTDAPASPVLYLRVTAKAGEFYRFAYSVDGRDWKELGGTVNASYIEGARVALTIGGASGASAAFDWIRITPARAAKDNE